MPDRPASESVHPHTVYAHSSEVLTSPVQDGLAMMDVQSGNYYGLDDIGIRIWELMDGKRSLGEICDLLTAIYDVEREQCWQDVMPLVVHMARRGLVKLVEPITE